MSDASKRPEWSIPAALAIPKGGIFPDKVEQGRYGPIFPKTPASYRPKASFSDMLDQMQ